MQHKSELYFCHSGTTIFALNQGKMGEGNVAAAVLQVNIPVDQHIQCRNMPIDVNSEWDPAKPRGSSVIFLKTLPIRQVCSLPSGTTSWPTDGSWSVIIWSWRNHQLAFQVAHGQVSSGVEGTTSWPSRWPMVRYHLELKEPPAGLPGGPWSGIIWSWRNHQLAFQVAHGQVSSGVEGTTSWPTDGSWSGIIWCWRNHQLAVLVVHGQLSSGVGLLGV